MTNEAKSGTLSKQEEALYRQDSNEGFIERRKAAKKIVGAEAAAASPWIAVAEGDSWFDYKPSYLGGGRDLLGHLKALGNVDVFRVSEAGDTLENMVYGTAFDSAFKPKPSQIEKTLKAIAEHKPDLVLFSAGGNDVAGTELEAFLNHAGSGLSRLRGDYVNLMFDTVFPRMFTDFITRVRSVKNNLPIFLHGYDYVVPDGRGVAVPLFGWTFKGPWLRPPMTRKRVLTAQERQAVINEMIDHLNTMLAGVAAKNPGVFHINLRNTLRSDSNYKKDWTNELHPTSSGFKAVAERFDKAITDALKTE